MDGDELVSGGEVDWGSALSAGGVDVVGDDALVEGSYFAAVGQQVELFAVAVHVAGDCEFLAEGEVAVARELEVGRSRDVLFEFEQGEVEGALLTIEGFYLFIDVFDFVGRLHLLAHGLQTEDLVFVVEVLVVDSEVLDFDFSLGFGGEGQRDFGAEVVSGDDGAYGVRRGEHEALRNEYSCAQDLLILCVDSSQPADAVEGRLFYLGRDDLLPAVPAFEQHFVFVDLNVVLAVEG